MVTGAPKHEEHHPLASAGAPSEPRASRLQHIANVGVSQLATAIATAGALAVTPAVLHGLGDAGYGGWLLINSFIGYMRLLDLGTSAGTIKFGAGAHARGSARDVAAVIDTSAFLFACIGTVALIVTIGFTFVLPWLFATVATDQGMTVLMLGAAVAIDLAFRPFAAALRMRSLYFVYDGIEIVTYSVFRLLLVVHFAHRGALSYRVLGLLTIGETVVRIGLVVVAAVFFCPAVRKVHPLRPRRSMIRRLGGMSVAMSIIQVADIVRFQLDAAIIGYFLPERPESIAVFGVGTRLPTIAYTTIGVIGAVLLPRFSGLSERGDDQSRDRLLATTSLVTGLVASFVLVNLAVLGPHFLGLWLRKPWVASSGTILLVMLPAYYIAILSGPGAGLLMGRGRLRGLVTLTVAEAAVNLLVSVILVRPFGILGVAFGTAIPLALFRGIGFPLLLRREIGLRPAAYARMHAAAILVGLAYLLLVGPFAFVPLPTYSRLVLLAFVNAVVFALVVIAAIPEARAVLVRVWSGHSEKRTSPFWSAR